MAATVNWNPNRFGSTVKVLKFDATLGTYSIVDEDHDYTGTTYNFTALPVAGTTTTTTAGTTTAAQTADAFGDVRPLFSTEGGGDGNGQIAALPLESEKETASNFAVSVGADSPILPKKKPEDLAAPREYLEKQAQTAKEKQIYDSSLELQEKWGTFERYQRALHPISIGLPYGIEKTKQAIGTGVEKVKKGFMEKVYIPGVSAARAVGQAIRPGADLSFRGVPGLYQADIDNMKRYGSTSATQGNPTGDKRKDDAGYNIVNFAGNYNAVGTNSRRSNMLKDATEGLTKNSQEWKEARNDARDQFKEEKKESDRYDREQRQQERDRSQEQKKEQQKRDELTSSFAGEEGPSRNGGGGGGKSIICTQMYQQTQLEDWKKIMQLWYVFQKKYLTIEHQEGYHFLFKPFVEGMKKSKILTAIGKHCAIARTKDIKHIMFGTPFSFTGRLVRLVSEPICYLTGKIKSWL